MKNRKCWIAVNKSGFINMFVNEPKRNEETGKWEGEFYLDSVIYKMIAEVVKTANMNWDDDPEYFDFNLK